MPPTQTQQAHSKQTARSEKCNEFPVALMMNDPYVYDSYPMLRSGHTLLKYCGKKAHEMFSTRRFARRR